MPAEDSRILGPANAFALLGDPVRLEIVATLHAAAPGPPLSFTDLYEAVAVTDTGRFNYHLDEVVGHFVTKTEAGYSLSAAGRRIARAIAAGTYTDSPTVEPTPVEGTCHACGESALEADYDAELFEVRCRECGDVLLRVRVPPSLARNRDPAAFVAAVDRWSRLQVDQATRGLCPDCGGAVTPSITEEVHDAVAFDVVGVFECPVCGRSTMTSVGTIAARDARVESFHEERGVSLWERPYWTVPQFVAGTGLEVESRDPWEVVVTFTVGGDSCRVTVDGDLEVTAVEVEGTPPSDG